MHSSEQTYGIYNQPKEARVNPESYTVIHRTDVPLGSLALRSIRTRLDVLADEREEIIDSRPETD